ncbi:MAG: hypothetical protein LBQ12_14585 [Deltaproteobacteria bacterium]|jgi:flagellar motor protein MotB|nr:hypothetical protein [Deltaproteobacteria bacterium]
MRSGKGPGVGRLGDEQGYLASVSDLMAVLFFLMMIALFLFAARSAVLADDQELTKRELQELSRLHEEDQGLISRLEARGEGQASELDRLRGLEARYVEGASRFNALYDDILDTREVRKEFLRHIEAGMLAKGKAVKIDLDEGVFRFPDDVLFDSAAFLLKPKGMEALDALGEILSASLPCYAGGRPPGEMPYCLPPLRRRPGKFDVILIEGHTDDVPLASNSEIRDNRQLSAFRSWSTYNHLMQGSPSLAELRNGTGQHLFGMSGYGENRPSVPNEGREDMRRLNRRVDFRIVLAAPEPSGAGAVRPQVPKA